MFCADENEENGAAIAIVEEVNGGTHLAHHMKKEFVRPFPPSSRAAYAMRTYRNDSDLSPNSPSVSVHIVNVSSPLSLQQTR